MSRKRFHAPSKRRAASKGTEVILEFSAHAQKAEQHALQLIGPTLRAPGYPEQLSELTELSQQAPGDQSERVRVPEVCLKEASAQQRIEKQLPEPRRKRGGTIVVGAYRAA